MFEHGLYMFRVTYMLCAKDNCCSCCDGTKKGKRKEYVCVERGEFFTYGFYMFCVACMICAHYVAVKFAIDDYCCSCCDEKKKA